MGINSGNSNNPNSIPTTVLREYIAGAYVGLRMQQPLHNSKTHDQTVMTPRQLLSILRLSQALARLRFSDVVAREDVDEAIRLIHCSKSSLLDNPDLNKQDGAFSNKDVISKIFHLISDYALTLRTRQSDERQRVPINT